MDEKWPNFVDLQILNLNCFNNVTLFFKFPSTLIHLHPLSGYNTQYNYDKEYIVRLKSQLI